MYTFQITDREFPVALLTSAMCTA